MSDKKVVPAQYIYPFILVTSLFSQDCGADICLEIGAGVILFRQCQPGQYCDEKYSKQESGDLQ